MTTSNDLSRLFIPYRPILHHLLIRWKNTDVCYFSTLKLLVNLQNIFIAEELEFFCYLASSELSASDSDLRQVMTRVLVA